MARRVTNRFGCVVTSSDSSVGAMSAAQEHQLLSAHRDLDLQSGDDELLTELAYRVQTILSMRSVMLTRRFRQWTMVGSSVPGSAAPATRVLLDWAIRSQPVLDQLAFGAPAVIVERSVEDDAPWTFVGCATHPPMVLAIRGEWAGGIPIFTLLSDTISRMWCARADAERARGGLMAHRLARRLSRARGLREVHEIIVHRTARAVHARIAALAVPDPIDGRLAIVATHGYPRELVEHLRIEPRTGVFGSVFHSRRLLLVQGFENSPVRHRRPRYRTDSFIVMPLVAGHDVLAAISVTDRIDNKPFTTRDVSMLRAMAAPAALALGRELALVQAEGYALTAAIDPLSGAFNRRHFHVRLEEELQRSRRHSLSLGFLMIDIDDFKAVNDSYGHLAGDAIIRDVAEILRHSVRVFDVCARFGGEEFAIIMPGSVVESAAMIAERIRERIEAYRPAEPGLESLSLTASIGLAVSSPGMTAHDLIESADRALYLAKRAGKNCVRVAGTITPASGSEA